MAAAAQSSPSRCIPVVSVFLSAVMRWQDERRMDETQLEIKLKNGHSASACVPAPPNIHPVFMRSSQQTTAFRRLSVYGTNEQTGPLDR